LVFYEAGIVVLSGSVFSEGGALGVEVPIVDFWQDQRGADSTTTERTWPAEFISGTMTGSCNALRHRMFNMSYNNTTEINSTIYFCRIPHNKYNYSSNPTYTSGSKIVVKNVASDSPVSYITTIGLYNSANELLAVAKLSEPLRKDPQQQITLRVRLDY
jgi:hypothetical protein